MFIDKKMSNRSFVPTNIISLLLLGIVSLVLWEFTRSSSLIRPAHGPFLALMVGSVPLLHHLLPGELWILFL